MYAFDKMHEALKKSLARTNLVEEDTEFFSMSLIALLKQQQASKGIPEPPFRRKFTTLFRVYEPLIEVLYDRPVALIKTFLLWENNFFSKIPKLHHRDQARLDNMDTIVRLVDAELGEVEDTVQERADRELEKIAEREKKSEEIKRRKKAQGKQAKKKPAAFEMTSDQGDLEKDATMRIRGYMKELDGIVAEAAESIAARGERAAEQLKDDQPRTKELLLRLKVDTEELLGKVRAAGLNPDDSDAEVSSEGLGELPEEELRFWRTLPLMSNLSILQTQCRHVDAIACAQTLRVSRLALAMMRSEQKRLNLYKPTSAADAERYIGALDQWDQHIQAENERVAEEHTQVTDERLTIERKAKFADYIKAVKTQALRLDGDLDAQFEVKGKFQAAATQATTAAKAAPERSKPVDDVREQVLKRRAAPDSDGESDAD